MAYDAIIIGSGFGGAITACRLAERGYRVLVLERGRRWDKRNFPRDPNDPWLWDGDDPAKCNGWLELRKFPNMTVVSGAGVGGGSLVYANVSCEAPPVAFDGGWPPEITHAELKPYADAVAKFMHVRAVPENQWTQRMRLVKEAAGRLGYGDRFAPLELAINFDDQWTYERDFARGPAASTEKPNAYGAPQGTCVHLGNCDIGCDVAARNTLDLNYLYVAENRHNAEVRALHLVDRIEPADVGYRVSFDRLEAGRRVPGHEDARLVIVAAGSLGSTELLLRCRDVHRSLPNLSRFLGRNWSSNGDFLTPAFHFGRDIEPTQGPTIASRISFLDSSQDGRAFWVQDGGLPNILAAYLLRVMDDPRTGFKIKRTLQAMQGLLREHEPFKNVMPWFAQGVDAANGTLRLNDRRLHLDWDVRESKKTIDAIVRMHTRLALATGGIPAVPLTWSLFKDLVTPHPLGGCNYGRTAGDGVVDHRGAAFGYAGLYVADGATVPRAIGVNPSRTIGALAERTAALIVGEQV